MLEIHKVKRETYLKLYSNRLKFTIDKALEEQEKIKTLLQHLFNEEASDSEEPKNYHYAKYLKCMGEI